jgi:hypothetical protein
MAPRLFVGSSSEAKPFVAHLSSTLTDFCEVHPWFHSPVFTNMKSTLTQLLQATAFYDFALFILSPDDISISRGQRAHSIRDNVLFELGLFLGALGPDRTIGVMQQPEGGNLKMPSDLFGIHLPRFSYKDHNSIVSAATKILPAIQRQVEKEGLRHSFFSLTGGWDFNRKTDTFRLQTDATKAYKNRDLILGQGLVLVIRKKDAETSPVTDTAIEITRHDTHPITLCAGRKGCLGRLKNTDVIESYLLSVPQGVKVDKMHTLEGMFECGCRIVDIVGKRLARPD